MAPGFTAVVPARDEEDRLPETLDALLTLPHLRALVVVDDGSRDSTPDIVRRRGIQLISAAPPGEPAGKGYALLLGISRARTTGPEAVLLADADLGPTAGRLWPLLEALGPKQPAAIASFPRPERGAGGGLGLVKSFARRSIARRNALGYAPEEPLSGQRALLLSALDALPGIAPGFGAEVGMTLDLLSADLLPAEVPLDLDHRRTGRDPAGFLHRARQGLDVLRAVNGARLPWPHDHT
ncbi:MAG: glycosyltransferase family 2 protein [Rubrobacter sp.]|nr:glycosyltransferase family 2 protein [Rubrobacter sp.]